MQPKRILIVEDSRDTASAMRELLELEGHSVRIAHDGAAAVWIARSFLPEIVLLDIGLPGVCGYTVARYLRAEPRLRLARLIALTGLDGEAERSESRDAGIELHRIKPVAPQEILRLVAGES